MQPISEISRSISTKWYIPLNLNGIHGFPNVILNNIRKHLSKFNGKHTISSSHHVQVFNDLMGDYEIAHEDVHMKLFV